MKRFLGLLLISILAYPVFPQNITQQSGPAMRNASSAGNLSNEQEWHFVVSGDSRNCGDLVMPLIANAAKKEQAVFYWHLGDLRAIYDFDQDMETIDPVSNKPVPKLNIIAYEDTAWQDFFEKQIMPFQKNGVPVFLGIGNHETIPPKTRDQFITEFADLLDMPAIQDQRLKDDPKDHRVKTYYHWKKDGIDFIYLDNASAEQFDDKQMIWLKSVLDADSSDAAITSIVVGMHKALPDSLSNWHSMSESAQGVQSGRCVYKKLLSIQQTAKKNVYILASHSHFFMNDIYNTPFWNDPSRGVLPGWIIGTAGAIRYRLPQMHSPLAQTDAYGYLLATVNPRGQKGKIEFVFREITPEAIRKFLNGSVAPGLIDYCLQNKDMREAQVLPELPDAKCQEVVQH